MAKRTEPTSNAPHVPKSSDSNEEDYPSLMPNSSVDQKPELVSPGGSGRVVASESSSSPQAVVGDTVVGDTQSALETEIEEEEVTEPGKVIRIGSMLKQLLDEVRQAPLDDASRVRMREIYEISVKELTDGLSVGLANELERLSFPFSDSAPSEAELRVAQAQLVGWLEGLFHGIQATLFAQQLNARSQLEQINQRGLPPGSPGMSGGSGGVGSGAGAYL